MSYYFSGSSTQLFLFNNTYPNCDKEFEVDLKVGRLNYFEEKVILYNQKIKEVNDKFHGKIISAMDDYFDENPDDDDKSLYLSYRKKLKSFEDQDKTFFTFASNQAYYQDGSYVPVDMIKVVNSFFEDFNTNYFEYYLMTQHLESLNCCFLFTFRKLSIFATRALSCKFNFCHFDKGVKKYINDLKDIELYYTQEDNGDWSVNSEQKSKNLNSFLNYFTKRSNFLTDTFNFYLKIFELEEPLIDFLVRLKVIIKIISIVNIIANSHSDDTKLFKKHVNAVMNLIGNMPPDTPATISSKYQFYIETYQKYVLPDLIDIKANIESKRHLTMKDKEHLKNTLIVFSLNSTAMIANCQGLYSALTTYLQQYYSSKINYFKDKSEAEKDKFEVNAYNDGEDLNECYIIDYDNPPSKEKLKKLKEEMDTQG